MATHKYWGEYVESGSEAYQNTLADLLNTTAQLDPETQDEPLDPDAQQALALSAVALAMQARLLRETTH